MKDTTKKKLLIAVGTLSCAALAAGIIAGFGGQPIGDDPLLNTEDTDPVTPVVDIQEPAKPTVNVKLHTDYDVGTTSNPGAEADSSGTEQTIQADPVKPEAPEPPEAPTGAAQPEPEHAGDDIPAAERNQETPPAYEETPTVTPSNTEPPAGSTNDAGQVYVPGFGYVDNSGANEGGTLDDMYENGNKIGTMGGD